MPAESCFSKGPVHVATHRSALSVGLNRGANLSQQSLLELNLESYTPESLAKFIERIELVLNSIPPSHQPSELAKFTSLFSRLKPCRATIHRPGEGRS